MFKRHSLTTPLVWVGVTFLALLSAGLTVLAISEFSNTLRLETEAGRNAQTSSLQTLIAQAREAQLESVRKMSGLIALSLTEKIEVDANKPVQVGNFQAPSVTLNGEVLTGNTEWTQPFAKATGAFISLWLKRGRVYVAINSSQLSQQGQTLTGQIFGPEHPAFTNISAGIPFTGEVSILGQTYYATYSPLEGTETPGEVVLLVGTEPETHLKTLQSQLLQFNTGPSTTSSTLANQGLQQLTWKMSALGLFSTVIAGLFLYRLMRRNANQIKQITAMALRLGNGNLKTRIAVTTSDQEFNSAPPPTRNELLLLARSMNRMAENLELTIVSAKESGVNLERIAREYGKTQLDLNHGLNQEKQSTTAIASVAEKLNGSLQRAEQSTQQAKDLSDRAKQIAALGLETVDSANRQIRQISNSVQDTSTVISKLGAQSQEISEIAKIIKSIAEQTNLLALNAAIEASRAGEHGRGFSVVADEVRRLAERTRKSTEEIHEMIQAIQQSTQIAIKNMNEAVGSVGQGVKLVDETGRSIERISEETSLVSATVNDIQHALSEQSQLSNQINQQVCGLNEYLEVNSRCASGIGSVSQELSQTSIELTRLLSKYQGGHSRDQTEEN